MYLLLFTIVIAQSRKEIKKMLRVIDYSIDLTKITCYTKDFEGNKKDFELSRVDRILFLTFYSEK